MNPPVGAIAIILVMAIVPVMAIVLVVAIVPVMAILFTCPAGFDRRYGLAQRINIWRERGKLTVILCTRARYCLQLHIIFEVVQHSYIFLESEVQNSFTGRASMKSTPLPHH